ncbi:uncharacterized protein NECHADRAFT_106591 [Fusarium vanettenii 77-13-4]|uniref:chitinase n=1 Tax=Fusarium vanettenii (strain ATCC MYA-4622 / CBS 123669 / FGSC 9596 / NRRL 45880 / 77-13-4) TaxID=660122 RepID=C7ZKA3_FUSV7|nr:uncharacterized protein NECHADRAFT_106591 [Fusarium vanettenii 77-13-4]EEU35524.1 hypothetical protein NECHADRAFT_106591 [Fusarium vanettenii 77-13-4]
MRLHWYGLLVLLSSSLSLQQEVSRQARFLAQSKTCTATQHCEIGCCSSAGHCGFGPDYCGEFGFCGTTKEFCGDDDKVNRPSCSVASTPVNRVIGYYEAWSTAKRTCYGMRPEKIPFGYYTHINFAFATIDPSTFELIPGDDRTEDYMRRIQTLKLIQPDVKVWIAVGGWTFNDPGPTATTFSDIAASTQAQDAFISSLIKMMNTYGFDGLDLDWEYPVAKDRNGRGEDFKNFVTFMDRLRKQLNDKGMSKKGISLTLPSSYWYLQHFDIKNLQRSIDWFNIMSYDIHGSWDIDNEHTGPWVNSHTNLTEIQDALDLLWRNDIKPEKVVMGMSFYSRSFTLSDPKCTKPGCRVASGGNPGKCSGTTGVLLHPEIQDIIKENKLSPTLHRDASYKAVSWGDQWVSFDDVTTWRLKNNVFRGQCISGIMVWAASQDDGAGTNIKALASSVDRKVMAAPDFVEKPTKADPAFLEPPKSCTWAACGQDCPSGFKLIWRASRCKSGYQSACCTMTESTQAWGVCGWTTGSCEMGEKQKCPAGRPNRVAGAAWAWGGVPPCGWGSSERSYCCNEPMPADFKTCRWITDVEDRKGKYCDACRDDQVRIAARSTSVCLTPSEALCCDRPKLEKRDDNPANDTFGSDQAQELRKLIDKYINNPLCPANYLHPPLHDSFQKRSLSESDEQGHDKRQATDCSRTNWDGLLGHGTNLIERRDAYMDKLAKPWDDGLAGPLDVEYQVAKLRNFSDIFPSFDPKSTVERILYNAQRGGEGQRRARKIPGKLCAFPPSEEDSTKRGLGNKDGEVLADWNTRSEHSLDPRKVWALMSGTSPNSSPYLTTILQGIINGALSLHYARWIWYTATDGGGQPGPMLELAYWIGSVPGRNPGDASLDQYRDTTPGRNGDRWVVFHLHFDGGGRTFLHRFNGRNGESAQIHMGANRVQVYHGHSINSASNSEDWRVYGGGRAGEQAQNAREGFDCREVNTQGRLWWVGRNMNWNNVAGLSPDDITWLTLIRDWGIRLYNDGIVGERAWRLIYPNARVVDERTGRMEVGEPRDEYARDAVLRGNSGGNGYVWFSSWLSDAINGLRRYQDPPPP